MSKIIVFGATGYAGGHITSEAISRGHHVVAVSRTIEPDSTPADEELAGDLFDQDFVRSVAADADLIVVAVRASSEPAAPRPVDALPTLLAIAAASGARLGVVGGAGTLFVAEGGPLLLDTPHFPEQAKPEALAQRDVLNRLRSDDSGARWFYLSPAAQFGPWAEGQRTGRYRTTDDVLITDAEGKSSVSGADFAIAFLDEVEIPTHENRRFGVAH